LRLSPSSQEGGIKVLTALVITGLVPVIPIV
jgi:hypothetical protein